MTETVLKNAAIVLDDEVITGTLAIDGGRITGVSTGSSSLPGAIDLDGDYLIPGLVELHTDNIERHLMPRPKAMWPVEAAVMNHDREVAGAGITTVLNALSIGHADKESRNAQHLHDACGAVVSAKADGHMKADHYLHLRCEVSCDHLMELVEPLLNNPLARLVSVMDHTPGQRQFASLEAYAVYYKAKYQMTDEQLAEYSKKRIAEAQRFSDPNRRAVVAAADARGIRVASHDDATQAHVAEAIDDGVAIAEFPTTDEAAKASHEAGLAVLMGAPNVVRGGSHSGNASARDFAAEGWLDILSSDYVPSSLLHGALILTDAVEDVELPQAIAMVATNPARSAGFEDRGRIADGLRADLVRFRRADGGAPVIRKVMRAGERVA